MALVDEHQNGQNADVKPGFGKRCVRHVVAETYSPETHAHHQQNDESYRRLSNEWREVDAVEVPIMVHGKFPAVAATAVKASSG